MNKGTYVIFASIILGLIYLLILGAKKIDNEVKIEQKLSQSRKIPQANKQYFYDLCYQGQTLIVYNSLSSFALTTKLDQHGRPVSCKE